MLTFIVLPKYLHLIYLQRTCYLSLYCELSAFWKWDMYVRPTQNNHLTAFSSTYVATRTPNSRRVYLETQDQNKNKLFVSDVVYGCKATSILQQCFQEQDAVTREDHNLWSLVHKRIMKMKNWMENPKCSEKTLFQCHFVYHKSQMTWSGIKPRSPRRDAVN